MSEIERLTAVAKIKYENAVNAARSGPNSPNRESAAAAEHWMEARRTLREAIAQSEG